jgi:hypothetical protein
MTAAAALGLANTWSRAKRIVDLPGVGGNPALSQVQDENW